MFRISILATCLAALISCSAPHPLESVTLREDSAELPVADATLAEMGAPRFQRYCASCHGVEGEGRSAPALNSQQFLGSSTDEQTIALIAVGVPGTAMSAYSLDFGGPLTSEQIEAIAAFVRTWEETAPDVPNWRNPLG